MDQQELRKLEDKCTQEYPAACMASCPIHVDVRAFLTQIKKGDLKSAYKVLLKKEPFTGIIGRICDHPCQEVCKRQEAGDAIAIGQLEKFCVENNDAVPAKILLPPKKKQRIAIVGAGLSGLTAAYDLAKKGYPVTLFEAKERLGGSIWDYPADILPRQVINDDLAVLNSLEVEIKLNTAVGKDITLAELQKGYDAVYLGVGVCNDEEINNLWGKKSNLTIDPVTFATDLDGVFAGGSMFRTGKKYSPVYSVSDGRRAAISIDRYLQKVSLTASRENEGAFVTRLFTNTTGIKTLTTVPISDPSRGYNMEEAVTEAERCIQCECLECVKVCQYLKNYGGYPKKYLRLIYNNDSIVLGNHRANKMINSCSLCGLCAQVCPNGLDMGEVCKASRQSMVEREKMPPSAHDFALRDMAFSNSDNFTLAKHQPGTESSSYLFFPGCQLSGSAPEQVKKVYEYLTEKVPGGVGIMLRCCGAPAEWAGRKELFQSELADMEKQWRDLGQPKLILACSSCYDVFKKYLPGVQLVSLWEVFNQIGMPSSEGKQGGKVAVHDACSTRQEKQIHQAVRDIITKLGYEVEELPFNREKTQCCGYGGLMSFANGEMANQVVQERIKESDTDYVAYCAMCRDNFASKGKRTMHLLDLILGEDTEKAAVRKNPGFSQRHEFRTRLKNMLLKEFWPKELPAERGAETIKLYMTDELKKTLEDRLILLEDIQKVLEYAEKTGNKLVNPENGRFLASFRPVSVTYWVEYAPREEGFEIFNAYSHRMIIKGDTQS